MNIKRALKEKNELVAKIAEEKMKVQIFNSVEVGAERPYDPRIALEEWISNIDKLVELKVKIHKAKIHKANSKVYDKIFTLAELKSLVKQLKSIDCSSGKQAANRHSQEKDIVKESVISLVERDNLVKKFEEKIKVIQEELDNYNAKTKI